MVEKDAVIFLMIVNYLAAIFVVQLLRGGRAVGNVR